MPVCRCAGFSDGDVCEASCISDSYEGKVVSICLGNNVWSTPVGSCKYSSLKCYNTPANPPLATNSYDWPTLGSPKYVGDILQAECAEGYWGRAIATCQGNNKWSAVVGSCTKSNVSCYGQPSGSPGLNSNPWPPYPADAEFSDGSEIEANCVSRDFVGGYVSVCIR